MVTSLFSRLGAVGLSLIAGALVFGLIAGGVVVHRLEFPPSQNAASHEQQGEDQAAGNADQPAKPNNSKKATNPSQGGENEDKQDGSSEDQFAKPKSSAASGSRQGGEQDETGEH